MLENEERDEYDCSPRSDPVFDEEEPALVERDPIGAAPHSEPGGDCASDEDGGPSRKRHGVRNMPPITSQRMHATAIKRNAGAKTRRRAGSRARYREKSAAYGAQIKGIEAARIVMNANPAIPPPEGA